MKKEKISFTESIIILIALLAILGIAVIKFSLSPEVPVLFTVLLLTSGLDYVASPGKMSKMGSKRGSALQLFQFLFLF